MKTNNVGSAKRVGGVQTESYVSCGPNTPPYNKLAALPKNMNKPFWQRFKEWWK